MAWDCVFFKKARETQEPQEPQEPLGGPRRPQEPQELQEPLGGLRSPRSPKGIPPKKKGKHRKQGSQEAPGAPRSRGGTSMTRGGSASPHTHCDQAFGLIAKERQ